MLILPAAPTDRLAILDITRAAGVFTAEEVVTVDELFAGYVHDAAKSGYNFLVARAGTGELLGFVCWGPTALSKRAADLYWICVSPAAQGRGVGRALFCAVETAAGAIGRNLIVIWTSSRPEYQPAHCLYLSCGCELKLRLANFYDQADDLCVYVKDLAASHESSA